MSDPDKPGIVITLQIYIPTGETFTQAAEATSAYIDTIRNLGGAANIVYDVDAVDRVLNDLEEQLNRYGAGHVPSERVTVPLSEISELRARIQDARSVNRLLRTLHKKRAET